MDILKKADSYLEILDLELIITVRDNFLIDPHCFQIDPFSTSNLTFVHKVEIIPGITDHEVIFVIQVYKQTEIRKKILLELY